MESRALYGVAFIVRMTTGYHTDPVPPRMCSSPPSANRPCASPSYSNCTSWLCKPSTSFHSSSHPMIRLFFNWYISHSVLGPLFLEETFPFKNSFQLTLQTRLSFHYVHAAQDPGLHRRDGMGGGAHCLAFWSSRRSEEIRGHCRAKAIFCGWSFWISDSYMNNGI